MITLPNLIVYRAADKPSSDALKENHFYFSGFLLPAEGRQQTYQRTAGDIETIVRRSYFPLETLAWQTEIVPPFREGVLYRGLIAASDGKKPVALVELIGHESSIGLDFNITSIFSVEPNYSVQAAETVEALWSMIHMITISYKHFNPMIRLMSRGQLVASGFEALEELGLALPAKTVETPYF